MFSFSNFCGYLKWATVSVVKLSSFFPVVQLVGLSIVSCQLLSLFFFFFFFLLAVHFLFASQCNNYCTLYYTGISSFYTISLKKKKQKN